MHSCQLYIKRPSEYRRVYDDGRKLVGRYYILFFRQSEAGVSRYGITVSGKVGGAVVRNRVKRRTREVLRRMLSDEAPLAEMVFVALGRASTASSDELTGDIERLLGRVRV